MEVGIISLFIRLGFMYEVLMFGREFFEDCGILGFYVRLRGRLDFMVC